MADRQAKTMVDASVMRVRTKSKSVSAVSESCVKKISQKKTLTNLLKVQRKLVSVVVVHGRTQQDVLVQLEVECHSCGGKIIMRSL